MNTHEQIKELLADFALRELSEQKSSEVKKHLTECRQCRSELKKLEAVLECADSMRELPVDEQVVGSAKESLLKAVADEETKQTSPRPTIRLDLIWSTIMKNRITKLAAAAVIIIAVLIGISQFLGGTVTFADVMQNIQNARTLTYRNVITRANEDPQVVKTMVLEPHLMRVELPDGRVWILDYAQGKTLILDSKNKQAVMSSTSQEILDLYGTFRNFRNVPDFSVSRIGQRTVDGVQAVGFELTRENDENVIIVWANPQTSLPIRIEQTVKDEKGQVIKSVTTDIIFDAELNRSLFRLVAPEGYRRRFVDGPPERSIKLTKRSQTASNMKQILLTCIMYAQDHEDRWPDSLQDLTEYGLVKDTLINPRQPERQIGYIYIKPCTPLSPQQVVLYEAYDSWGDGINVGYADGHVHFIKEEYNFKNDLQKPIEDR